VAHGGSRRLGPPVTPDCGARAFGRPRGEGKCGTQVLCVKFCKGGHGWLESCGLAELNFLVLFEIVHIEIAVGFEPVLVGLDG
jgi:hypothetical protein